MSTFLLNSASLAIAHDGHPHLGNEWIHHTLEIAVVAVAVYAVYRLFRMVRRKSQQSNQTLNP